ncbi:hypothetical protein C8R43DRAFT_886501 [Mycena crocata]|nr:hypothetical protein C8R43DRAFT_886501 [Mycena crocata]
MSLVSFLRSRTAKTTLAVVKETEGVQEATKMARAAAKRTDHGYVDLQMHPDSTLHGTKLATLTQAMAYRAIKELRDKVTRKATESNVQTIQEAIRTAFGKTPTVGAVWKSIRNKDISRQVRNFLWKSVHGANRVGKYWRHIPDMEDRANCQVCGVEESMQHILFECTTPGQSETWLLSKDLWLLKHETWPSLSIGAALGCGLATFKSSDGKPAQADDRLYRIIMSETVFFIWKLRCDRVIKNEGAPFSQAEVRNRWIALMNERLHVDRSLTNKIRFGKQYAVHPQLVLDTWRDPSLRKKNCQKTG